MIRDARQSDAAAVAAIFRPVAEGTAISFASAAPSAEDFRAKIADTLPKLPWLVDERQGKVLGYAYASPHRALGAYRWCVELSVYVAGEARGRGVGRGLYVELIALLRRQGYQNAYAGITLPNDASVALHESLGFRRFAVYPSIGWKLGRWHDVGWWSLALQERYPEVPPQPIPYGELDARPQ